MAGYEYQTYESTYVPVSPQYPGYEEHRKAALDAWTAALTTLGSAGWEVCASVPPSLSGNAEPSLLLRRALP